MFWSKVILPGTSASRTNVKLQRRKHPEDGVHFVRRSLTLLESRVEDERDHREVGGLRGAVELCQPGPDRFRERHSFSRAAGYVKTPVCSRSLSNVRRCLSALLFEQP
jgi:hypothetical protein